VGSEVVPLSAGTGCQQTQDVTETGTDANGCSTCVSDGCSSADTAAGCILILTFIATDHAKVKGKHEQSYRRYIYNRSRSHAMTLTLSFPGYNFFAISPFTRCKMKARIPTLSLDSPPAHPFHLLTLLDIGIDQRFHDKSLVACGGLKWTLYGDLRGLPLPSDVRTSTVLYTSHFSCR
jgi:hypothetical protein